MLDPFNQLHPNLSPQVLNILFWKLWSVGPHLNEIIPNRRVKVMGDELYMKNVCLIYRFKSAQHSTDF